MLMDYFLVLKLFPGDPILDPPISGTSYLKNATEVSLLGGGGGRFLLGGPDYQKNLDKNMNTEKNRFWPNVRCLCCLCQFYSTTNK